MYVTDIYGNSELLIGVIEGSVSISKDLEGKNELSFSIAKTEENEHVFEMVKDLAVITVGDENYEVRVLSEGPYSKSATCLHEFFENVDVNIDYELEEGSYSLDTALNILSNSLTEWSFLTEGSFGNANLKNFGDDNVVALLNVLMEAFDFEYTATSVGKVVTIKERIGAETDHQVRYGHNLNSISKSVDANNIKTHIKVKYNQSEDGEYLNEVTYISPNAGRYPKPKWARTVEYDTTSQAAALLYGSTQIKDTPIISLEVAFSEVQKNGFEQDEIGLGDSFFLIDERMKESDSARVVEITTFPYSNKDPVVTLSNRLKYYTDLSILQQQNQQTLEENAVKKGENLDGVILTEENGMEVKADNFRQVKIFINAKEGITIQNGLIRKFYVDTMGNVNFDGRLNITNGDGITQLLEAYKDTRGGRLNIFDSGGLKNISMGSEIAGTGFNGGVMEVYSDLNQNSPLVEISARAANQFSQPNGTIVLKDSSTNRVEIKGSEGLAVVGSNGAYTSFIGSQTGYINGQTIVTQPYLSTQINAVLDYVNSNFQPL